MLIRIAELNIDLELEEVSFFKGFETEKNNTPIIKITYEKAMGECHGIQFAKEGSFHILRRSEAPSELLCSDKEWSDCVVYASDYGDAEYSLPLAAICSKFALFNAIFLHGSIVEYKGDGIVFVGYSGVGKTTQARLWEEYLGATPINGDKVFLRKIDDIIMGCGSPWKGSSEYRLNKNVPVKGVVVLNQAKENKIRKLSSIDCIKYFMPHVFFPHWDEKCKVAALDTFNEILEKIPVWLLECRPDEEAVLLTKKTIL